MLKYVQPDDKANFQWAKGAASQAKNETCLFSPKGEGNPENRKLEAGGREDIGNDTTGDGNSTEIAYVQDDQVEKIIS